MKKLVKTIATAVAIVVGVAVSGGAVAQETSSPITGQQYLYIEEFEIATDTVPNDAIAELSGWVTGLRETGEFKSVRLYIHNTGPRFALYILLEPKNWQSLETGMEKFLAANPGIMSEPYKFGLHSDNLLSEIPVE
jgi:hypothetical protein